MTQLWIGDRAYSSWSLRGWLLFERFGIDVAVHQVDFLDDRSVGAQIDRGCARTVPTAVFADGAIVSESLALAEELATRHPDAGIWPEPSLARATARTLAAEMASGFAALRTACPMNLRCAYGDVPVSDPVNADLRRLEAIWDHAHKTCGADGPWLCGAYSAADAFFAPVAARIAGYGLEVGEAAQAYTAAHLADPAFRRWRALALVAGADLPWYARDHPQREWPGPPPLPASPTDAGPAVNDACPYSGRPVSHFLMLDGARYGFCNALCRDKTLADPTAWPAFSAMLPADLAAAP